MPPGVELAHKSRLHGVGEIGPASYQVRAHRDHPGSGSLDACGQVHRSHAGSKKHSLLVEGKKVVCGDPKLEWGKAPPWNCPEVAREGRRHFRVPTSTKT